MSFAQYPKAKYHATDANSPKLVHSEEQELHLGQEWKDVPHQEAAPLTDDAVTAGAAMSVTIEAPARRRLRN